MTRSQYRAKYYSYLNSVQWQSIKELVHIRDDYRCRLCGVQKPYARGLHCHHMSYAKWFVFQEYKALHLLVTLCRDCHERVHHINPKLKEPTTNKMMCGGTAEVEVRKAR